MKLIHFWQGFLYILGICLLAPDGHTVSASVLCCTGEPYNYTFLWPGIIHSGNPNIPDPKLCLFATVPQPPTTQPYLTCLQPSTLHNGWQSME